MNTSLQSYNATLAPDTPPLWPSPPLDSISNQYYGPSLNCGISSMDALMSLTRHVFTLRCTLSGAPADCIPALAIGFNLESIKNLHETTPYQPINTLARSLFSDFKRMQFESTLVACYHRNPYLCFGKLVAGAVLNYDLIGTLIQNGIESHYRKGC